MLFNYKKFKVIMQAKGHEVHKKGEYITIKPNNLNETFFTAEQVIEGFEDFLKLVSWVHYNTWIYSMKFKIR